MRNMDTIGRERHWDGTLSSSGLDPDSLRERNQLATAARAGDWEAVLGVIKDRPHLANSVRPDGQSWFAPLHQAAYMNAPPDVIRQLIALGAFRALKNSSGQCPVDIARLKDFEDCASLLEPTLTHLVDPDRLGSMQELFHGLVRAVMRNYRITERLRLPELSVLTELDGATLWFPISGMYGGFSLWLEREEPGEVLIAEHWSRVASGSGMRHRITSFEVILLERGFV